MRYLNNIPEEHREAVLAEFERVQKDLAKQTRTHSLLFAAFFLAYLLWPFVAWAIRGELRISWLWCIFFAIYVLIVLNAIKQHHQSKLGLFRACMEKLEVKPIRCWECGHPTQDDENDYCPKCDASYEQRLTSVITPTSTKRHL